MRSVRYSASHPLRSNHCGVWSRPSVSSVMMPRDCRTCGEQSPLLTVNVSRCGCCKICEGYGLIAFLFCGGRNLEGAGGITWTRTNACNARINGFPGVASPKGTFFNLALSFLWLSVLEKRADGHMDFGCRAKYMDGVR